MQLDAQANLNEILWDLLCFGYDKIEVTETDVIAIPRDDDRERFNINCPPSLMLFLDKHDISGLVDIEKLLKEIEMEFPAYQVAEDLHLVKHKPNCLNAYVEETERYLLTLNGIVKINSGDWIIIGVNGEQYPCDPEIFKKLYDVIQ